MSDAIPRTLRDAMSELRPSPSLAAQAIATAHSRRRRRRGLTALAALLAITAGVLTWVNVGSGGNHSVATVTTRPTPTAAPTGVVIPIADRRPAQNLTGTTLAGKPLELAKDRGAVVVVSFFGSWCSPCRVQMPILNEVAEGFARVPKTQQSDGVAFIAVSTRDAKANAASYVSSKHITLPVVLDDTGQLGTAWLQTGPPATYIVDRNGRIAAVLEGIQSDPMLRSAITTVAGEEPNTTPDVVVATKHLSLQLGQFSLDTPAPGQAPLDVRGAWAATAAKLPGSLCSGARRTVVTFGLFTGYNYDKRPEWLVRCEDIRLPGHFGAACLAGQPCARPTAPTTFLADMVNIVDPKGKLLIGFNDDPS
jgi:thiol-disulfide isomerase/thioredoxin